jgi:hypothetical protein
MKKLAATSCLINAHNDILNKDTSRGIASEISQEFSYSPTLFINRKNQENVSPFDDIFPPLTFWS